MLGQDRCALAFAAIERLVVHRDRQPGADTDTLTRCGFDRFLDRTEQAFGLNRLGEAGRCPGIKTLSFPDQITLLRKNDDRDRRGGGPV